MNQRSKPWAHRAGKVEIGAKWEDPTLSSPILRSRERLFELDLEPARRNLLTEIGSQLIGPSIFLALAVLAGQALGVLK